MPCLPQCDYAPDARLHHICTSITLRKQSPLPPSNYAPHARLRHICTSSTLGKAIMPVFPQCNYAHNNFKEKLWPACHAALRRHRAATAPQPLRTQRLAPLAFATPCIQSDWLWKHGDSHTLPYYIQTGRLPHACHANCHLLTVPPHEWAIYNCLPPAIHCERQSRLASPNVTTCHMCACTTSATALHCEKLCPACHAALRRHRAATAPEPRRTQRLTPLALATLWKHTDSHTSLLSHWRVVPGLPRRLPPLVWANGELPLDYSTTWLSSSSVSYLLIALPFDCAIKLWTTSWLLYDLTAQLNCEVPLDYSTAWLSYWIVSYHLTELFKCELPLGYSTTWQRY